MKTHLHGSYSSLILQPNSHSSNAHIIAQFTTLKGVRWPSGLERWLGLAAGRVIFFPINSSGMGRFQQFDFVVYN